MATGSVEIERDVLELHGFLFRCGPRYFVSRYKEVFMPETIFDFLHRLVHACKATT